MIIIYFFYVLFPGYIFFFYDDVDLVQGPRVIRARGLESKRLQNKQGDNSTKTQGVIGSEKRNKKRL